MALLSMALGKRLLLSLAQSVLKFVGTRLGATTKRPKFADLPWANKPFSEQTKREKKLSKNLSSAISESYQFNVTMNLNKTSVFERYGRAAAGTHDDTKSTKANINTSLDVIQIPGTLISVYIALNQYPSLAARTK